MSNNEVKKAKRMPTFTESIIPIIAMMVILTVGKGYLGYPTEPLLLLVEDKRHNASNDQEGNDRDEPTARQEYTQLYQKRAHLF